MKVLAIGDVVSPYGCEYLKNELPKLKRELEADIVIVNGENSASGNGILPQSADSIFESGVDVITTGNHVLRRKEIYDYLDNENNPIIRPANFHSKAPGRGMIIVDKGSYKLAVINLQGSTYMDTFQNPFSVVDSLINKANEENCKFIIIDLHAEVTSEKRALGFYVDGRVSAVFGTHTHVQTSDNQIMPCGTGYLTDLGMTGPYYSVLGVTPEIVIEKFKTNMPVRFENPNGPCVMEGCLFEFDNSTGLTVDTKLIRR